jgi:DNA-binding beta-propeller fold protein YncE
VTLSTDGGTLYVADSLNNRIAAIADPLFRNTSDGVGDTFTSGGFLNDPLGLITAPNGDLLSANGDDGNLVRINTHGTEVSKSLLDSSGSPPGSGALFGLAIVPDHGVYYVDDATNTLNLLY